jgi:MYXO-CTERM domain-containing protein
VSGTQVTTLSIGTCTIAADQPGNVGIWLAASTVTRSFQVTGLSQTITFNAITPLQPGDSTSLSATASSGLAVTFSSQTASVCSVSGNTLTVLTRGTCTVAADQAGDSVWLAATTVTRSFVVSGVPQTISFGAIVDRPLDAGSFSISVSASSGLPVTVTSQTPSVCSISSTAVTTLAVGTCTLIATQAGDSTYAPAPNVPRSFEVTAAGPSEGGDGDAPLPLWAWVLLGLAMFAAVQYSQRQNDRRGMRA